MTHESHGFCFCGETHCGNGYECDGYYMHPRYWVSPALTRHDDDHEISDEGRRLRLEQGWRLVQASQDYEPA